MKRTTHGPGPEKKFEALVRLSLGVAFPERHAIWKSHPDEFGGLGMPDFFGHIEGKFVGLELKVAPNYFSTPQRAVLRQITRSGGHAWGLLLDGDTAYLLPIPVVETFSYRARLGWLPVPWRDVTTMYGSRRVLDLLLLRGLMS